MLHKQNAHWTTYHAVIGSVMREQRNALGRPQRVVATQAGMTQPAWSKIEKGESPVTARHLFHAAAALECTPGDIVREADRRTDELQRQGVRVYPDVRPEEPPERDETSQKLATAALIGLGTWLLLNSSEEEENDEE